MQAMPDKSHRQSICDLVPDKVHSSPTRIGDQSGLGGFSMSQSMFEKNYLLGMHEPETTAYKDAFNRQSFPDPTTASRQ